MENTNLNTPELDENFTPSDDVLFYKVEQARSKPENLYSNVSSKSPVQRLRRYDKNLNKALRLSYRHDRFLYLMQLSPKKITEMSSDERYFIHHSINAARKYIGSGERFTPSFYKSVKAKLAALRTELRKLGIK